MADMKLSQLFVSNPVSTPAADDLYYTVQAAGNTPGAITAANLLAYNQTGVPLLAGRAGGQTLIGGTAASEGLILTSTSNGTKGTIALDSALYVDGVNGRVGINKSVPTQRLQIANGHIRFDRLGQAGAPTVATGAAGVLTGAYKYAVTFVTAVGETSVAVGNESATVNPSSQQVSVTNIPVSVDASCTARKVYRTPAGGAFNSLQLLTTINDNTTTSYTDNTADGSLGAVMPWRDTTGGNILMGSSVSFRLDVTFTAFGLGAGGSAGVGGYQSVAFGSSALAAITTGYQNAAFGFNALAALTTGLENLGISYSAGAAITTGQANAYVGASAGQFNQTGNNNTGIGRHSLFGASGNSNSNNTALGYNTGEVITTGGNNIFIGYRAGDTVTTGGTNILLGYDIDTPAVGTSNFMSIGNLLFSAGIDGTGTTPSSGSLGVGIAAPGTKLHVVKEDSATNTVTNAATIEHQSSGTPAASFGTGLVIAGEDSTTISIQMARLRSLWTTATHASYATRSVLSGSDNAAERDVIGFGANGSAALLGFYPTVAAAPIIQPASANQAAVVTTPAALASYGFTQAQADAIVTLVNQLRSDLVSLGLIKGSA